MQISSNHHLLINSNMLNRSSLNLLNLQDADLDRLTLLNTSNYYHSSGVNQLGGSFSNGKINFPSTTLTRQ